jgi:hypothetical protein
VSVDEIPLAVICCRDFDVVTVTSHGARSSEEFSSLSVDALDHEGTLQIWQLNLPLQSGQSIYVALQETGATDPAGRTKEELFPNQGGFSEEEWAAAKLERDELRKSSEVREGWSLAYNSSAGRSYSGRTSASESRYLFSVVWHSGRSDRVRVGLTGFMADHQRSDPRFEHVHDYLEVGQSATLVVDA